MRRTNTDLMAIGLILASAAAGAGATLALTASRHDTAPRLSPHAIQGPSHSPDPSFVVRCRPATVLVSESWAWKSTTLVSVGESSEGSAIGCTNAGFVFVRGPGAQVYSEVANLRTGSWRIRFSVNRRQSPSDPVPASTTSPVADPG